MPPDMQPESTPDFTIVTPSYNYARFVRDCLDSVAAQEGVTVEHLIYDPGSTDGTLDILAEYPHARVVVEPDKGMSDAINKGFRAARGKWVMWLNTDDILKPGALQAVKQFAEDHPGADVIHGAWEFVDRDRKHLRYMKSLPAWDGLLVYYGCYLASTALFLKRETTIGEGFLLNDRFRYDMDGEYYARLKLAGKTFANYNKVLAEFRCHDENLSARRENSADIDTELLRQRQWAENRAITRTYGKYWLPFRPVNEITDALLLQYWRLWKAVLHCTTPWVGGKPLL